MNNFAKIPAILADRNIFHKMEEFHFDARWAEELEKFFKAEKAVNSVDYEVVFNFEDYPPVNGYLRVYKDGRFNLFTKIPDAM